MRYATKSLLLALICWALALPGPAQAGGEGSAGFDLALVLAVDLSDSINPSQYQLQMAGIAQAFEDKDVQAAILSGQHGAILVTLVAWSDKPQIAIPWTPIGSTLQAVAFGERVRGLPRLAGNFTCMAGALQFIEERILPQQPAGAERQIVDVSGDGRENCNPATPLDTIRARLVGEGVTINGLAILEGKEADTLEQWYADNVIGGPFSFVLPAAGYGDFARSMRRKFIVEISMASTALVEP